MSRTVNWITQYFCKHRAVTLVKYKRDPLSKQDIRLRPSQQFYECWDCGKRFRTLYSLDKRVEKGV